MSRRALNVDLLAFDLAVLLDQRAADYRLPAGVDIDAITAALPAFLEAMGVQPDGRPVRPPCESDTDDLPALAVTDPVGHLHLVKGNRT